MVGFRLLGSWVGVWLRRVLLFLLYSDLFAGIEWTLFVGLLVL